VNVNVDLHAASAQISSWPWII